MRESNPAPGDFPAKPRLPALRHLPAIEPGLAAFIDALPKAEAHLHLDGALSWERLRERDPSLPERPFFWAAEHRYGDFLDFLNVCHHHVAEWLTTPERYADTARTMLADCAAQNVRYVETSMHLPAALNAGSIREIIAALRSVFTEFPVIEARLFVGLSRNCYDTHHRAIEEALVHADVAGFDLHGIETLPVEPWTSDLFQRARAAGKFTKVHAGEQGPPALVRHAVEALGVNRIEHGVRAVEDPAVVQFLVDRGVTLDVCPISNLKLGVTPSLTAHPIAALHRAGVACTINTDDPFCFGNTLREDYAVLALQCGLNLAELAQLARNGFASALLTPAQKAVHFAAIDHVMAARTHPFLT